jgi:hypothetical protein
MLSSTCHYAVVNAVHSVIFVPRDSCVKRFLYAWFTHLYPYIYIYIYIYAFVYCLTFIVLDSLLSTAWLTQARGCWVDRVLAGAFISRGSPGLPATDEEGRLEESGAALTSTTISSGTTMPDLLIKIRLARMALSIALSR